MQISVEKTSELSRKMTIHVPEATIMEKVEARLKSLAKEVKLDGFRPGKVPSHVVKKMFGARIRGEITGDLIQSSYVEALKKENLNPAGSPHIVPKEGQGVGDGFEYVADFEVFPEVSIDGIDQLQISRPIAQVQDADLDKIIENLREQKKLWKKVERACADKDRATIHFTGVCEEEKFTDGKVENFPLILGSKQMIPGFENQLLGLEAGATKSFDLTFPEDYKDGKLAGKEANFEIEIVTVEEPELPKIDADFIKAFGVDDGDEEKFRGAVRNNLENELENIIKGRIKNNVMDALYAKFSMDVPAVLIDQEIEHLKQPYKEDAKRRNQKVEDLDLPSEMFEAQA